MEPPGSLQGWHGAHMGGRDPLTANGRKGAGNTPGQSKQHSRLLFLPSLLFRLVVLVLVGSPSTTSTHHEACLHKDAHPNSSFSLKAILLAPWSPSEKKPGHARDSGGSLHPGEWTLPGHRHRDAEGSQTWFLPWVVVVVLVGWRPSLGMGQSTQQNHWSEGKDRDSTWALGVAARWPGEASRKRCLFLWVCKEKLKKAKEGSNRETNGYSPCHSPLT